MRFPYFPEFTDLRKHSGLNSGLRSLLLATRLRRRLRRRVANLGIEEIVSAPRSPWQNPYVERLIGTIRRELLDHVIVVNDAHLKRLLADYLEYYHHSRTHQSLGYNAPSPRKVEPPELGNVVAIPQVGGLHHRYIRRAA
jgi:putative transposase